MLLSSTTLSLCCYLSSPSLFGCKLSLTSAFAPSPYQGYCISLQGNTDERRGEKMDAIISRWCALSIWQSSSPFFAQSKHQHQIRRHNGLQGAVAVDNGRKQ